MTPALIFETFARGKLLLTGEYFVLDGAEALALPVRYGQTLRVETAEKNLHWRSLDMDGSCWFEATFTLPDLEIAAATDLPTARTLVSFLQACRRQAPGFLRDSPGFSVTTQNDFPRPWGLGTSSTLLAALAKWAQVDPYAVLFNTLGGSGYDLACAYADGAIIYQLEQGKPNVETVDFQPVFAEHLYFVYLGKKQDSRAGIKHYQARKLENQVFTAEISALTRRALAAARLEEFEKILAEHEQLVSRALDLPRAKDLFFPDYWGAVKSLGAWGGDFVLATSRKTEAETQAFFNEKGCSVFIPYSSMTASGRFPS